MGLNPLGSNKKARSTLIFKREVERVQFKNAIADVATTCGLSPSETVLNLVFERIAAEPKARSIARTMYASETPRTQDGFEAVFQDLAANGEDGRDSEPLLRGFLELALDLGLSINTTDDESILLVRQWDSIVSALGNAKEKGPEAALAARSARELGTILDTPCAMQPISPLLGCLRESWATLRAQSCTFRALCCLARMAFPTHGGVFETAETRLAFLRTADGFYASSGKGGSS